MKIPAYQSSACMRAFNWHNLLAGLMYGLMSLLAYLSTEHHLRHYHNVTGQADTLSRASVALLLPSQPILHLLASPDRFGGDDDDKTFFYGSISRAGSELDLPTNAVAFTTAPSPHYLSAREDNYSPRAPPHS